MYKAKNNGLSKGVGGPRTKRYYFLFLHNCRAKLKEGGLHNSVAFGKIQ